MKLLSKGTMWRSNRDAPGKPWSEYYIEIYSQPLHNLLAAKIYHQAHQFVEKALRATGLLKRLNRWWEIDELPSATTFTKRNMPIDCHWDCVCFEYGHKNRKVVQRWENVTKEAYDAAKGGFFYTGW